MVGFHTAALTQRCIARDHTRQALLRIAEDETPGQPDRLALLFDFSGIPEIGNRLFFRAMLRFLEEGTGGRPLAVVPIALNCVVAITDSDTARIILEQMNRLASFLRERRHGSFEVSCFDLKRGHWQFAEICRRLAAERPAPAPDRSLCLKEDAPPGMEALDTLITVGEVLGRADIATLLRQQSVWFFPPDAAPVKVGREFWISMRAVEKLLGLPLAQHPWLFERTTQFADHCVLTHMLQNLGPLSLPLGINLHLATIFTGDFRRFAFGLRGAGARQAAHRHDLIVELPVQECLQYPEAYAPAADILDEQGICIALDRLQWQDLAALPEAIARRATYIKVIWPSVAGHAAQASDAEGMAAMATLLERFGADKLVLTRCDHPDAIGQGLRLGIRRFQGRGITRYLFNTRSVERLLGRRIASHLFRPWHLRLPAAGSEPAAPGTAAPGTGPGRPGPEYHI
ncbi:MAG TPA: hypothetical protein VF194_12080 [Ferrovibrio sp.]|uniref:hypothetical protein n=1 Tax=Ferrovibrio sp. TaxID=1917215 RepID=UPI002ED10862